KADMEMEALDAGVLAEIRVQEGESAPVGAVIAVLSEDGTGVTTTAPQKSATEKPAPSVAPPAQAKKSEPSAATERPSSAETMHPGLTRTQEGGEINKPATVRPATPQEKSVEQQVTPKPPVGEVLARQAGSSLER